VGSASWRRPNELPPTPSSRTPTNSAAWRVRQPLPLATRPLGHQIAVPQVPLRDLRDYDWLYGVQLGAQEVRR